jgi:hypothetical protein
VGKFVGKFRQERDYSDDFNYRLTFNDSGNSIDLISARNGKIDDMSFSDL